MQLIDQTEIVDRINEYLCTGGLFNPELADHDKVRMLLLDCRDFLANSQVVFVSAENHMLGSPRDQKG